ncbi:hypothetical protein FKG94_15480 [Exilibacterium tricleocarpae]|uniref:Heme NO-binding domain-containing protein n=1 Tax=Exilibacterium tricleocarpae TaxID=2591008 RepID=A0A545TFL5_9GAMM|nr:heme NO-binding domain-containing protein [Exilibacterium tricleocarpae]TQV76010.1 hypothetical protein FKG94_15480 [Exilibacterium tricleocarpae]
MKGAVFIAFNEMVEGDLGMATWEQLLLAVKPASEGVYTSVEDYPDTELFALVEKLAELTQKPVEELVRYFGRHLFDALVAKYPMLIENEKDFFRFLMSIDDVIHKEVRKLYENPNLPDLRYDPPEANTLVLYYHSPRKLCILAEGLIAGAAQYYGIDYELSHGPCMHSGADECRFIITRQT